MGREEGFIDREGSWEDKREDGFTGQEEGFMSREGSWEGPVNKESL
jgi:hypothetical protein